MRRGYSRNSVAVVVSMLVLLVAGGRALAAQQGATDAGTGVAYHLPPVDLKQLPSQSGYEIINGNDVSLDLVIGSDNRQQVTNTTNFPNSAVTYIEAWKDNDEIAFLCTAAFVGPKVLLTAAHCLWIPEFGGYPDGIAVVPGLNGDDMPFGFEFASDMWVPDGWIDAEGDINHGYESDYGLITLESDDLSDDTGEFTVGALSTTALRASDFEPSTAGYPADKSWGTQWFGSSDKFVKVEQDLLEHDIDAFQGQSGSPIWRGSDLTVVGIMSFETTNANYARRITSDVLNDLNRACNQLDCDINQTTGGSSPTPTDEPSPTATSEPSPTATNETPTATAEPTGEPTSTATATIEPTPTSTTEPTPTATMPSPDDIPGDTGAFDRTWQRTDDPVQSGVVSRTWMWGPAFTDIMVEPYDEAAGGYRVVLYHEKSRMEITNPDGDASSIWYVTNGLIAKELVTGEMQLGDSHFEDRSPAMINVAGDADDPNGPTYASFFGLLGAAPFESGSTITATVDRAGNVGDDPSLASYEVTASHFAPETNHTVASVFWNFMNSSGPVYDAGGYHEDLLFQNPYFATGLPISEPYWATVRVGGTERTVLVQVFERRVLTYTPGNPPGWEVEAGNVGSHYYEWRYNTSNEAPDPGPTPEPPSDDAPEVAMCLDQAESDLLTSINDLRTANSLDPLANSAILNIVAYDHSDDMGRRGYYDHEDPDGLLPWDRAEAAGYEGYTFVGEYIAAGIESPQTTFDEWIASPTNNPALLEEDYAAVGLGRVYVADSEWGWYWTVLFGSYVDAAPACG